MAGSFTITAEPTRALVRVVLAGFFGAEEVVRLGAEVHAAIDGLGTGRNQHLTLCDVSACDLQSQAVVGAFQKLIGDPRYAARRLAFVTSSSLARMQVRRMLTRPDAQCFDDQRQAVVWLMG